MDVRCEIHGGSIPCKACRKALGLARPNIYVRHGQFSKTKKCLVHELPLALWHRLGKWECPQRMCPYTEKHACEWEGVTCHCDTEERDLDTDDMDVRASRIVAHYEAEGNCSTAFMDRFRDLASSWRGWARTTPARRSARTSFGSSTPPGAWNRKDPHESSVP